MTFIRLDKLRTQYKPQMPLALRYGYKLAEKQRHDVAFNSEVIKELLPNTYNLPFIQFDSLEKNAEYEPSSSLGTSYQYPKQEHTHPINIGVVLSGGQAPGGHNVIAGIFDALKKHNEAGKLIGFTMGVGGLLRGEHLELSADIINRYRNSGGFDMIGSDRTKLTTDTDFDKAIEVAQQLSLDALIIVGGDDSNTNAALLAEYAKSAGSKLSVIGCPKTIDGDLKNQWIETSFGFDSCVKVYSEMIGNIQRDCFSAKKYYHFIKLMGRSASHITLECALMTQPTIAIISEEIQEKGLRLKDVVKQIADVIQQRSNKGLNFGTVLIPEGLMEFLPGTAQLLKELNTLLEKNDFSTLWGSSSIEEPTIEEKVNTIADLLTPNSRELFLSFTPKVSLELATVRDPHGNVQVSRIPTEELIADLVTEEMERRKKSALFHGDFQVLTHFFGYEGRCSMPSNFDATYCYALGRCATELAFDGRNGYMAVIANLTAHPLDWQPEGIPLSAMMDIEERKGKPTLVIKKSTVDLSGAPMRYFVHNRKKWAESVCFYYPGPLQFFGPSSICDNTTITLRLEQGLSPYEEPMHSV